MKRIAILVCGKAVGNACTGSSCMKAMNCRKGTFARYESEEIELQAFFNAAVVAMTWNTIVDYRKK